jgi:nucleoside 2-deoxyribosyltransferase/sugar/nucleoside kinase (ribokinase family)
MKVGRESKILLIGQVIVDVTLPVGVELPKLRFGGIIHAARALWALGCTYGLAYTAPEYLEKQIQEYAGSIGASLIQRIGVVIGSPNVLLIRSPKEYGPQGYDYLLKDELNVIFSQNELTLALKSADWTNIILFPGGFDLNATLAIVKDHNAQIDIDANFQPEDWDDLRQLGKPVDTLILSTSSQTFLKRYNADVQKVINAAKKIGARYLLFKENRGGSRLFNLANPKDFIRTPAQLRPIVHSVGVGDSFNVAFAVLRNVYEEKQALAYASCIAAEYASTTYIDDFKDATRAWLKVPPAEVVKMKGVALGWEERSSYPIYIAAPDFDYVNRYPIDQLVDSLRYHNFSPRLPIRENGQADRSTSKHDRTKLYQSDLALLEKCSILVAVLIYDDPGTFIEIGIALERRIPIIVYDPYSRAENLMLTESPKLISSDLDEIVMAVFEEVQTLNIK